MTSVLKRPMTHSARALVSGLGPMASAGLIAGITDGSDRGIDFGCGQALGILNGQVLGTAVRMVDQALRAAVARQANAWIRQEGGNIFSVTPQNLPDPGSSPGQVLARAIEFAVVLPSPTDLEAQGGIGLCTA